ncbi:alpha/beta fold hydrolase [Nocardia iowensis]|uniref:Alpha/beta fold hydrolase n=1 Tax=Nocardia iowensis TaxID=204891 RepID=A0ABX8RZW3_NOCIO|nr:alpha/beta fold hydrolase [Nocardia iowensis]
MTGWNRIERGAGRPLVLLHGGGASARCWLPVLDRLSTHRRVIALDFPSFGRTPAPTPDIHLDINWIVDELAVELRRLGIDGPVDPAGNSMGGLIGWKRPSGAWRARWWVLRRARCGTRCRCRCGCNSRSGCPPRCSPGPPRAVWSAGLVRSACGFQWVVRVG